MSNKNEVFEYLVAAMHLTLDERKVHKQQCEDLAHEVLSLKNQLRDASAQIKELQEDNIRKSEHISHMTGQSSAYRNDALRFQAQVDDLVKRLATATGDAEAYKLARKGALVPERSGCRKEDAHITEPWVKWEGGECPVPKDTIVQIRMRDGTSACEPGVAGELRWDHRGWRGDITRYRVVKPECEHEWQFYGVGFPRMCIKCGLKR